MPARPARAPRRFPERLTLLGALPKDKIERVLLGAAHLYALSGTPNLPKKSSAAVTRESLLAAISGITLSKAVLNVTYSR